MNERIAVRIKNKIRKVKEILTRPKHNNTPFNIRIIGEVKDAESAGEVAKKTVKALSEQRGGQ